MAGYFDSPSLPKMRLERKGHQIEQMALVLAHSVKFILPGLASCCGILLGQRPTLPFFADGPGLAHASELSKRTIFSRYVMSLASHLVDSHPVIKKKTKKKGSSACGLHRKRKFLLPNTDHIGSTHLTHLTQANSFQLETLFGHSQIGKNQEDYQVSRASSILLALSASKPNILQNSASCKHAFQRSFFLSYNTKKKEE